MNTLEEITKICPFPIGHENIEYEQYCTAGNGYYQEWGKDIVELHAGDVVNIPAEVKHWHGATKNSWFSHIAISVPCENGYCEWLEEVEKENK